LGDEVSDVKYRDEEGELCSDEFGFVDDAVGCRRCEGALIDELNSVYSVATI
jgi:hypothetical protein